SGAGVYAQRFTAAGQKTGGEFRVNVTTDSDQTGPSVVFNANGGFVVAWYGKGTGDANGIFIREYAASGTALSGETLVNSTTDNPQRFAKVVAASSGY